MNNYFANQIVVVDTFLVIAVAILSITIIAYSLSREFFAQRRNKALANIKSNTYAFILSGTKPSANTCAPLAGNPTSKQFLDMAMNRDGIFFNKDEQDVLKSCFASPEKISNIEKMAEKAHNKWRRIEAMLCLSYLDDKKAPAIFEKALLSKDADIRYFAVLALGQIKNERSSRILINLIKKNDFSRRKIVSILETFPADITVDYTAPLLKNHNPDVRFWALRLLSRLGPGKYVHDISALAKDPSGEVRSAVCECLGNFGDKTASDILFDALKDENWLVRSSAVKAASELLGDKSIPKVLELLGDSSLSVLSAVREALAAHIDTAMPYIKKISAGDDRMAKIVCTEAIEEAGRSRQR